jgi:hypothetical protein
MSVSADMFLDAGLVKVTTAHSAETHPLALRSMVKRVQRELNLPGLGQTLAAALPAGSAPIGSHQRNRGPLPSSERWALAQLHWPVMYAPERPPKPDATVRRWDKSRDNGSDALLARNFEGNRSPRWVLTRALLRQFELVVKRRGQELPTLYAHVTFLSDLKKPRQSMQFVGLQSRSCRSHAASAEPRSDSTPLEICRPEIRTPECRDLGASYVEP